MSKNGRARVVHGFEVEEHDLVASTQALLRDRLMAGANVVDVVVRAKEQTAGRGRRGTPWTSAAGGSYQSLALPSDAVAAPSRAPGRAVDARLTLALGLGIAEVLSQAGAPVAVKWPNDLILLDKKLGGIIVEVVSGTVLVGIGLNVNNQPPAGAASLRGWDVGVVGDLALEGVRVGVAALRQPEVGFARRFKKWDWLRGRTVSVETRTATSRTPPGRSAGEVLTVTGVAAGIENDGSLRVDVGDGTFVRVVSGHVSEHR